MTGDGTPTARARARADLLRAARRLREALGPVPGSADAAAGSPAARPVRGLRVEISDPQTGLVIARVPPEVLERFAESWDALAGLGDEATGDETTGDDERAADGR